MADGPRCKRRKQANPRRNNVTNYNNVVETNSDSDDEDKLHIVEDESLTDPADCDNNLPDDDLPSNHAVLPENGRRGDEEGWDEDVKEDDSLGPDAHTGDIQFKVKDECGSEAEDEQNNDPSVEEILQQGDTAVIYPEAPEEEQRQGTPEASSHDENGTPDAFSQLLTCPYCDRGYKRYTSLKEHIKYRHEKNEDNFSCSLCSYTFAYRTQLDRHMTAHKSGRDQRHVAQSGGNRKFKCTECGKAFKYKHHLKEHLRIHSGEKPYECPNCKKRFSHSGSYSSHISSKKCIGVMPVNGRPRPGVKTSQCPSPSLSSSPSAPSRTQLREKIDNSKPLQEQLPLNQIKTEPVDFEYKPIVVSGINCAAPLQNGVFNGGSSLQATASSQGVVQAVVLPTVGLVSPISINLSDIQNVLKVAVLENAHANSSKEQGTIGSATVQQGSHSVISAFSLPLVDQDGTTKIIINYSLEQPSQVQVLPLSPKKEIPGNTEICKTEKLPEDLTVKTEKSKSPAAENGSGTCLLCDDCPSALNGLQEPKHCNSKCNSGAQTPQLNGTDSEKCDSAVSSLPPDANVFPGQPPLKNLLSLLKAYYALNAQPTTEELSKISDSVNLPLDVVKKWFEKMQSGQISMETSSPPSEKEVLGPECDQAKTVSLPAGESQEGTQVAQGPVLLTTSQVISIRPLNVKVNGSSSTTPPPLPLNLSSSRPVAVKTEEDSEQDAQAEPLDLSLPKQPRENADRATSTSVYQNSVYSVQEEPLNLTCTKKEQPVSDSITTNPNPIYVSSSSANPINIAIPTVTTQLPTIVAITDKNSVPCLRALATNKSTILIPQVTYTYSTMASSPAGCEAQQKAVQTNGNQDERQDTSSEGVSTVEDQNDLDSTPPRKKMRKTENGMYACDLCDKIFQKSSSLLRHKYEHTGKRPHECGICNKAFKHKHHLIEHMRLHSGEKPYQCDKCGKRFSHSGSYSQHMNHRYSYCKREAEEREGPEQHEEEEDEAEGENGVTEEIQLSESRAASPPSHMDSDDRESSTREDEESEKEDEEDEEEETEVKAECTESQAQEEEEEEEEEVEEKKKVVEQQGAEKEEEEESAKEAAAIKNPSQDSEDQQQPPEGSSVKEI
ncbi:zinc finger E-box-binding homeobox 1b isoform X1 [Erpetoichthys calabaricus]|uniref:zinc finger E-box-binding homeobox 1b isoform X1 n=1 Tax=Erpetoichthys calabaricus TaxID=27687 RepID=UPI0010A0644C|nr:zinc finger E-box-binding homeobox 1b isoform X1 [Erpetoichthys calabaricus]